MEVLKNKKFKNLQFVENVLIFSVKGY